MPSLPDPIDHSDDEDPRPTPRSTSRNLSVCQLSRSWQRRWRVANSGADQVASLLQGHGIIRRVVTAEGDAEGWASAGAPAFAGARRLKGATSPLPARSDSSPRGQSQQRQHVAGTRAWVPRRRASLRHRTPRMWPTPARCRTGALHRTPRPGHTDTRTWPRRFPSSTHSSKVVNGMWLDYSPSPREFCQGQRQKQSVSLARWGRRSR